MDEKALGDGEQERVHGGHRDERAKGSPVFVEAHALRELEQAEHGRDYRFLLENDVENQDDRRVDRLVVSRPLVAFYFFFYSIKLLLVDYELPF